MIKFCDILECDIPDCENCSECFTREFWLDVLKACDRHFRVNDGNVYSMTNGEGGFSNRRFTVVFENGSVFRDMGLWYRGVVPNSRVRDGLRCADYR